MNTPMVQSQGEESLKLGSIEKFFKSVFELNTTNQKSCANTLWCHHNDLKNNSYTSLYKKLNKFYQEKFKQSRDDTYLCIKYRDLQDKNESKSDDEATESMPTRNCSKNNIEQNFDNTDLKIKKLSRKKSEKSKEVNITPDIISKKIQPKTANQLNWKLISLFLLIGALAGSGMGMLKVQYVDHKFSHHTFVLKNAFIGASIGFGFIAIILILCCCKYKYEKNKKNMPSVNSKNIKLQETQTSELTKLSK
jgi:hypothetical protein